MHSSGQDNQSREFLSRSSSPQSIRTPKDRKVNDTGTLSDGRIYVSMEYLPHGSPQDEAQGAPIALSRAKRLIYHLVLRGLGMHTTRE